MKDFNNTYIRTDTLSVKGLEALTTKYEKVLGIHHTHDTYIFTWCFLYYKNGNIDRSDEFRNVQGLKEITEQDLDKYLKEQDMIKYEKVEGMTVGQIVQLMAEGVEFYRHKTGNLLIIDTSRVGIFIDKNTVSMDLGSLRMELNDGNIYRKVEAPWWEKHVGSLVAVRYNMCGGWQYDVFKEYNKVSAHHPFQCKYNSWKEMRPLTQSEKDSIITKD